MADIKTALKKIIACMDAGDFYWIEKKDGYDVCETNKEFCGLNYELMELLIADFIAKNKQGKDCKTVILEKLCGEKANYYKRHFCELNPIVSAAVLSFDELYQLLSHIHTVVRLYHGDNWKELLKSGLLLTIYKKMLNVYKPTKIKTVKEKPDVDKQFAEVIFWLADKDGQTIITHPAELQKVFGFDKKTAIAILERLVENGFANKFKYNARKAAKSS